VQDALAWSKGKSSAEIRKYREDMVNAIEREGATFRAKIEEWLVDADEATKVISREFNGPLAKAMAKASGFNSKTTVDCMREGCRLLGALERTGLAAPIEPVPITSIDDLRRTCEEDNLRLLASLREDKHHEFLLEEIKKDVALGRMDSLTEVEDIGLTRLRLSSLDLSKIRLSRRFSREQGTKADGSVKLRAGT